MASTFVCSAPPPAFTAAPSLAALPWLRDTTNDTVWVPVRRVALLLGVSWQSVVQWMAPRGALADLHEPRTERTRTLLRSALTALPTDYLGMARKAQRILVIRDRDLLHYLCQRFVPRSSLSLSLCHPPVH